jgi:hypothetical protein
MNTRSSHKKIAFVLVCCVTVQNIFMGALGVAYAQGPGEGPQQFTGTDVTVGNSNGTPYIIPNQQTGLTSIFGRQSSCSLGANQSELFNEILGPLASASRASSILGQITGSDALRNLGYQINEAGQILNSAGSAIGSIQDIADGNLSGILNASGGISELGNLLDQSGLVDVGGLVSQYGGQLSSVLQGGLSQISGFVSSAVGSVFGGSASSLIGSAIKKAAPLVLGEIAGVAGNAALSVPVNDFGTQTVVLASVNSAQSAITERQDALNEVQSSLQFKEYVLDCTTWNASHRITEQVVADTLDFITRGNTGISWITGQEENSFYLDDPVGFYKQLGDAVSTDYINELNAELPNTSYKQSLIALLEEDQKTTTVADRLTPTVDPLFYTDFMAGGGWQSYLEVINNPVANDPFSGYMFAKDARDARIATVANTYKTQLDYGQGYFPDTDENGKVITPPQLIKEQSNEAVSTGVRSLENAQNFWQLVGNLGTLTTNIFRGFQQRASDGTTVRSPSGLSNINTSRIITPPPTGTANPFAPSVGGATTSVNIVEKLTATQNALIIARAGSPVFADSFNALVSEATALRNDAVLGTPPTRVEATALHTNINALITQLQPFSTATWYANAVTGLTTARQNVSDIIAYTNV